MVKVEFIEITIIKLSMLFVRGTKLRADNNNKSFIRKIFPKVKPVRQVIKEAEQSIISKSNKKVAAGIFWSDMLLLICAIF